MTAILAAKSSAPRSAAVPLRGPHLFPFDIVLPSPRELENCGAFEIAHYGLGREVFGKFREQDTI